MGPHAVGGRLTHIPLRDTNFASSNDIGELVNISPPRFDLIFLSALSLWTDVNEEVFAFVSDARWQSVPRLDWAALSAEMVAQGAADWRDGEQGRTVRLRSGWRRQMQAWLDWPSPGSGRQRMLDHWLQDSNPRFADKAALWARRLERWEAMEYIWIHFLQSADNLSTRACEAYSTLPEAARRDHPMLTWAFAAAQTQRSDRKDQPTATIRIMLRDSAMLHAQWRQREDATTAVLAGTFWMALQRFMPSSPPTRALEDAWSTQNALDGFVKDRRGRGQATSEDAVALFHSVSAEIALIRGDLSATVTEAGFSTVLGGHEETYSISTGLLAVALELAGEDGATTQTSPGVAEKPVWGPHVVGADWHKVADGLHAIRTLDRTGSEGLLAEAEHTAGAGAGAWPAWSALRSVHCALWEDPAGALRELDATVARRQVTSMELHEPLASEALERARVFLLNRTGALESARELSVGMPAPLRWVPLSRTLLWAGEWEEAILTADAGLLEPETWWLDRQSLQIIRAAALAVEPSAAPEVRQASARQALRACLDSETFLPLAALPRTARLALLNVYRQVANDDVTALEALDALICRLDGLTDSGDDGHLPIRLTKREQILLPLLATVDSVPDIATQLHLSANTVRKQVVTLRAKFDAHTRAELVRRAREGGFLR